MLETFFDNYIEIVNKNNYIFEYGNKNNPEIYYGYKCIFKVNEQTQVGIVESYYDGYYVVTSLNEKFAVKKEDVQIINDNAKLANNLTLLKTSNLSEKEILNYLINETSKLSGFHKLNIVESYQNDIIAKDEQLDIELKDLYKKLIREDYNGIYNAPITTISKIISVSSVQNKIDMILNELYIYNYIPHVRLFLENNIGGVKSDNDKYLGQGSKVYSIVEFTEMGQAVFIGEDQFLFNDKGVELINVSTLSRNNLQSYKNIEQAIKSGKIDSEGISFTLGDNFEFGIKINEPGNFYINGERAEPTTDLEKLFMTTQVPFNKKSLLPVIHEIMTRLHQFTEIDVCLKVTNRMKKNKMYIINYLDKIYCYDLNSKSGNTFYEFDSPDNAIKFVKDNMEYDISDFIIDKLDAQQQELKMLRDREKVIQIEIDDTENKMKDLNNDPNLRDTTELKDANILLENYINKLNNNLNFIKNKIDELLY